MTDRLLWFEDAETGREVALGSYEFTRDNVLEFAREFDPQAFHIDDAAAASSHFGRLCASGWHTAAAQMRCFVETLRRMREAAASRGEVLPEMGPSPGVDNLEWLKPVYPGDTVSFSMTVTGRRELRSRPDWGLIFTRHEGVNQNNQPVFRFDGKVMVARRPEQSPQ